MAEKIPTQFTLQGDGVDVFDESGANVQTKRLDATGVYGASGTGPALDYEVTVGQVKDVGLTDEHSGQTALKEGDFDVSRALRHKTTSVTTFATDTEVTFTNGANNSFVVISDKHADAKVLDFATMRVKELSDNLPAGDYTHAASGNVITVLNTSGDAMTKGNTSAGNANAVPKISLTRKDGVITELKDVNRDTHALTAPKGTGYVASEAIACDHFRGGARIRVAGANASNATFAIDGYAKVSSIGFNAAGVSRDPNRVASRDLGSGHRSECGQVRGVPDV